jgi:hypothetical protein
VPSAIRRYSVLSGLALCAVFAGPIAVAQASDDTMRGTLNSYAPKIVSDEHAVKKGLTEYPQGKVRALPRALKREVRDLRALRFTLMHESPSSAGGALAQVDIVQGLGLIAKAYGAFDRAVQAAHGGPVSGVAVNAAVRTDTKGRKKLKAGLKLLR